MKKNTFKLALIGLLTTALSFNLFGLSTSIQSNQSGGDTITLNPIDDSYISQTASNNYGSENEMVVKMAYQEESPNTRIAYLKFDFSNEELSSTDIYGAKLRLYCSKNNVSEPTINVHRLTDDSWTESSINGANEPLRENVISSTVISTEGQYYEWDISTFVASEADGDDVVSLVVFKTENESNVNFASKEASANRPELVIIKKDPNVVYDLTILASAGLNGSITPSGSVAIAEGYDQTFEITANEGYAIADVEVDGTSVGSVNSYKFTNIITNHTISASFVEVVGSYIISADAGSNGSITPVGSIILDEGMNQAFTITPDSGYKIADLLVDGASVGALSSYTFTDVTANHTISASFVQLEQSYSITASAGLNGSITPEGRVMVDAYSDQSYTIAPDAGYEIREVLIDGASVGAVSIYTFSDVIDNHTISASFVRPGDSITSRLWGVNGENWDPDGPLRDFTNVGYRGGNEPIPHWPIGVYVTDFGAVGDGVNDDTEAFIAALDACPKGSAVYVPVGRYIITEQLNFNRDSVVLRGEDMYETVLYFPYGLKEIYPEIDISRLPYQYGFLAVNGSGGAGTHRSMENFTIEFREEQNLGHWSNLGTNAIDVSGASDCWIRSICIKNANNGITLYSSNITILDVVFDNFEGRVGDKSEGYAGHQGIKINTVNNLVHNVTFKANDYEHTISFNNSGRNNVLSRISSNDSQLDDHGGSTGYNLFTELDLGEGTPEVGRQTYRGAHDFSTFWNVNAVKYQPYKEVFNEGKKIYQGADIKNINTVVGLKTNLPTAITEDYWHEKIDPLRLYPQNIYLAQLLKLGKDLPASFDKSNNPKSFAITANAESNGSIIPDGIMRLAEGSNQAFTIVADSGYIIVDVLVDSSSVGAVGSYTFSGVKADHTISAVFAEDTAVTSIPFIDSETDKSFSFIVYPNPASGSLHINGIVGKAHVRIFDLMGKEWIQTDVSRGNVLNLSNLKTGIYIIEVREEDKHVQQVLFIE